MAILAVVTAFVSVKLSWSGGSAPYDVKRWDNLFGSGTPAFTTTVGGLSFDDDSLNNGLNASWIVD